jgi:hypothetical protein
MVRHNSTDRGAARRPWARRSERPALGGPAPRAHGRACYAPHGGVRFLSKSCRRRPRSLAAEIDPMYGPAVRRKRFGRSVGFSVLHQCIRPLIGACAPGHHGYQRACVLITGQASSGPFGSPVFACAGKTGPPSLLILSQTSAENRIRCYVIACFLGPVPLFVPGGRSSVPACH